MKHAVQPPVAACDLANGGTHGVGCPVAPRDPQQLLDANATTVQQVSQVQRSLLCGGVA